MNDLWLWLRWKLCTIDWGFAFYTTVVTVVLSALVILIVVGATTPHYSGRLCQIMERKTVAFERCLADEKCLYTPEDLYSHEHRLASLKRCSREETE